VSLLIWLFGRDEDHALDRALRILACLPYELRSNEASVTKAEDLRFDDDAESESKARYNEEIARSVGLSIATVILRETPKRDSFLRHQNHRTTDARVIIDDKMRTRRLPSKSA
jgi:hypothetical protein